MAKRKAGSRILIGRTTMFNSWVGFYRDMPVDQALDHCSASCGILESRARRLGKLKYHSTKDGFRKRELQRVMGMALGVHKQIAFILSRGKVLMTLTDTGRMEGGGRVQTTNAAVGGSL